ncbi:MAG: DUF4097 family beta strand repeat-containing protein [Eubacteriales bacterium]
MKKFTKISLISGGIFLVVGFVVILLTSFMGGMSAWTSAMGAGEFSFLVEDFSLDLGGGTKVNHSFQKELIRSITVDALYGDVEVTTHRKEEILVTTTGKWEHELSESGDLTFYGTVQFLEKGIFSFGNVFIGNFPFGKTIRSQEQEITIYLPESYEIEGFAFDIDVGDIQIEGLVVQELTIDARMGNVEMEGIVIGDARVEMNMGNFEYEGQLQGDLHIVCNMGNIEMVLDSKEVNHNYQIKCDMGNVEIGTYHNTWMGVNHTMDNGANSTYQLTCNMGNIEVEFK